MLLRTKVLVAYMISSMVLFPSSTEAQEISSLPNKIFPESQVLNENRPVNRTHPYGGTLVWGVFHKPTIINPALTTQSISASLIPLIFDSLVKINIHGKIEPGLAKSWDVSKDRLTYTFYLHEGVEFHNGVELTAEDVKFTYDLIKNPKTKSVYRIHFELVDRFEVVEKYIFRVVLKKPFFPLMHEMVRYIMPKHLLLGKDPSSISFNYHPIGTGPFKFKEWDRSINRIELMANSHYFEGRPYLDKIIVKTYPDVSQVWTAFMRHEVDLVQWITSKDYAIVEKDPTFKAYAVPGHMYYAMDYNVHDSIWRDKELRQAVAHGIDKRAIIESIPGLEGIESVGPFHPKSIGYNHEVKPFTYDPVKAKMMLMHRGWQDMNADVNGSGHNIRKKDRKELELRLLVDERNAIYQKIAKVIRKNLSEIGVKTKVLLYKSEQDLTQEYLDEYKPQAWLRFYVGFGFNKFDSYDTTGNWYSLSSQSGKLWQYKNDEVDRLYELASVVEKESDRVEIYRKIHKIIYEDQPACFLFYPAGYFAVSEKFKNTDEYFSVHMPTYTLKDWYIDASAEMK